MHTLNAPAIVAAEKITAMREPSSERLYQLIGRKRQKELVFGKRPGVTVQQTYHDK
jgi:hypothetical protein